LSGGKTCPRDEVIPCQTYFECSERIKSKIYLFSAFIVCLYEDPVVPEQVNEEHFVLTTSHLVVINPSAWTEHCVVNFFKLSRGGRAV
jgi:hypothetical protein